MDENFKVGGRMRQSQQDCKICLFFRCNTSCNTFSSH